MFNASNWVIADGASGALDYVCSLRSFRTLDNFEFKGVAFVQSFDPSPTEIIPKRCLQSTHEDCLFSRLISFDLPGRAFQISFSIHFPIKACPKMLSAAVPAC